jgi:hypothetical protein
MMIPPMKNKSLRILNLLSFLILFSAIFYTYLDRTIWDYDFWWHISTGRYIVENGHLPEDDPFSYPSELAENKNLFPTYKAVVLKGYWIAQIIFFLAYKTFGDAGMIFLRSFILMLVILSVFWGLKRDKVKFYLIFPFIFLTFLSTLSFTGERPVLFTLLFSVLCFLLLDSFKRNRKSTIFILIPLMLLWANMHCGFMIGDVIIAVFIVGETFDIILKRATYKRRELLVFYSATILSIAVSGINPNGFNPFIVSLSPEFRIFTEGIQEYQSVFILYWDKIRSIDIAYIIFLTISPVILILRARKMDLSRIILLSGLLIMSLVALRFIVYFVTIGTLLLGREANHLVENLFENKSSKMMQKLLPVVFGILILMSSIVYFVGVTNFKSFRFDKATKFSVPKDAVDFIERNQLRGNIFNDFGFGGYLTWRLHPWKKNFIDTRSLNHTTVMEYGWVLDTVESIKNNKLPEGKIPLWKRLLDHYDVNLVLLDTIGVQGNVPPLLLKLLENDAWVPVYADLISAVFIRNTEKNQEIIERFEIPKETVYNSVIVRATQWAIIRENPAYLISIGDIFYNRGMIKDAVTAYEYAAKRLPRSHPVRLRLEKAKEEIESM